MVVQVNSYLKNHINRSFLSIIFIRLIFSVSLTAFLFVSFACTEYKIKNIYSQGEDIICFGNSITSGVGSGEKENYPYLLSELMGNRVINAGRGGDTSSDGLNRLEEDVLVYHPRLVIVEFGGNDFLQKIPLQTTINNIQVMIERIQEKGAMAAIADVSSGITMKKYRREFKKLAKKTGAIFIPLLLEGIINNASFKSDPIHPNAAGYKLLAERVYKIIIPYIDR